MENKLNDNEKFMKNLISQMSVIEKSFDKNKKEVEAVELGMDEFEMMRLVHKRGKEWCLKEIKQYDNK